MKQNSSQSSTYFVKKEGKEVLEMYTAATGMSRDSGFLDKIAISSTHFRHSRLTVAVIFGCTEKQMRKVERLLSHAPEVKSHPLLMVGVFAELHRDRVDDIVRDAFADCDIATLKLGMDGKTRPEIRRSFELSRELRNCRLKAKRAEEEVRSSQGQLHKMMGQIEELVQVHRTQGSPGVQHSGEADENFTMNTLRFKHRFEEISIEFDAMMAQCRMTFDDMTYTEELVIEDIFTSTDPRTLANLFSVSSSHLSCWVMMRNRPGTRPRLAPSLPSLPCSTFQSPPSL
jgi:hypothetical protein